jgi:hypothetical protein
VSAARSLVPRTHAPYAASAKNFGIRIRLWVAIENLTASLRVGDCARRPCILQLLESHFKQPRHREKTALGVLNPRLNSEARFISRQIIKLKTPPTDGHPRSAAGRSPSGLSGSISHQVNDSYSSFPWHPDMTGVSTQTALHRKAAG